MTSKFIKALKLTIISNYFIKQDFFSRNIILRHNDPTFQEAI
jgi:hypothetical protein